MDTGRGLSWFVRFPSGGEPALHRSRERFWPHRRRPRPRLPLRCWACLAASRGFTVFGAVRIASGINALSACLLASAAAFGCVIGGSVSGINGFWCRRSPGGSRPGINICLRKLNFPSASITSALACFSRQPWQLRPQHPVFQQARPVEPWRRAPRRATRLPLISQGFLSPRVGKVVGRGDVRGISRVVCCSHPLLRVCNLPGSSALVCLLDFCGFKVSLRLRSALLRGRQISGGGIRARSSRGGLIRGVWLFDGDGLLRLAFELEVPAEAPPAEAPVA